jgi:hypothetical protein
MEDVLPQPIVPDVLALMGNDGNSNSHKPSASPAQARNEAVAAAVFYLS